MKLLSRLMSLLILLLAGIVAVSAQDDVVSGEVDLFGAPLSISAVIYQTAETGILDAVLDVDGEPTDLHQLTLTGVPEKTTVIQVSPPGSVTYDTADLARNWGTVAGNSEEDLLLSSSATALETAIVPSQADAELSLLDLTVYMTIVSAQTNPETGDLIYFVLIDQVIPVVSGEDFDVAEIDYSNLDQLEARTPKLQLPFEFGNAVLTISGSDQFWRTIQGGAQASLEGVRRPPNPQCEQAESDLEATRERLRGFEDSANELALIEPDAVNEPDEWEAWNLEARAAALRINAAQRRINEILAWMRWNNCPAVIGSGG